MKHVVYLSYTYFETYIGNSKRGHNIIIAHSGSYCTTKIRTLNAMMELDIVERHEQYKSSRLSLFEKRRQEQCHIYLSIYLSTSLNIKHATLYSTTSTTLLAS